MPTEETRFADFKSIFFLGMGFLGIAVCRLRCFRGQFADWNLGHGGVTPPHSCVRMRILDRSDHIDAARVIEVEQNKIKKSPNVQSVRRLTRSRG